MAGGVMTDGRVMELTDQPIDTARLGGFVFAISFFPICPTFSRNHVDSSRISSSIIKFTGQFLLGISDKYSYNN